ncbi:glycoside hydrolase family 2 TIM barrel-domain containing protein [Microbacterium sp. SS28]|uniref:glycoside hydrolase family 2 TIM barrel-domain containing protein n=1 Tax=Microbacterium sp. SS28 TaxID=2919948 RepID=UPI001FAB3117|nr:glycoside hydrolase family 2 TIM barrel-domain containing protein [Microbacterium sp. SS28]
MQTVPISRWAFALGDDRGATAKGFDDSSWRAVTVPHDWSVEHAFSPEHSSGTGYLPGGIGWYRAHVPLSEVGATDDQHVRLAFHGVYKNADVWVNGYHLGSRPSGYAAFSFDLTEILSYAPDDDLVVSVRVDHTDISDSRWYNGSGITRRVELEVHERVRVAEYGTTFTTLFADESKAVVRVVQTIVNDTNAPATVRVRHELRSLTSDQVHGFETEVEVPAGGSADAEATKALPDPELWSDIDPRLHRLTTTLEWAGDRPAVHEETVGIRTFAFDPDTGFSINGERRILKGVCLHEDAGCFGTAVPASVWVRRLLALKDMGCNAVRMAHNPHSPELYALCDILGLFVIDEAFDEWENPKNKWWQGHNVYPPRHEGYAKDFPVWHEADLGAMIDAHRNHPSIIAWSIGNEIDYPNDPYAHPRFKEVVGNNDAGKPAAERLYDPNRPDMRRLTTIASGLVDIAKAKDPTRPVTLAAALPELSSHLGLLDRLDLVGYNYKEHLYEEDHRRFPGKPFIGSENSHRYADWLAVERNDYVAGQFLWTGIDYLGETRGWPSHGSTAGLLTVAGFPKETFHLRRSWWSDEPVARIAVRPAADDEPAARSFRIHAPSRRWDAAPGRPLEVLCFGNGDELRLTHGDDEIDLVRDEELGCWTAETTTRDEPLVLETLRAGEVVARDTLRPGGDAVRLDAAVWTAPAGLADRCVEAGLAADGVVQIECTLRDADGEVARDERSVSVEVRDGELLGLENGDLSDDTPYTAARRRTLDGRVIVFVRSRAKTTVVLSSPGLPDVRMECST